MVFDISKVSGLGDFSSKTDKDRTLYYRGEQAFLVDNGNTIEVRCDYKLSKLLEEKYESVMKSRYFGTRGIEIVLAHQLDDDEINDLVRLSYNLTDDRTRP